MRCARMTGLLAACGTVLMLVPDESQAKPGQDWSRVQGVAVTRPIRVVVHDDTSGGRRQFSGVFGAATADSLTIVLRDGTQRRLQREVVRRVSVKRAFLRRPHAWGLTALAAFGGAVVHWLWYDPGTQGGWWVTPQLAVGIVAIPVWVISTAELSHKPIYAVPRT